MYIHVYYEEIQLTRNVSFSFLYYIVTDDSKSWVLPVMVKLDTLGMAWRRPLANTILTYKAMTARMLPMLHPANIFVCGHRPKTKELLELF